MAQPDLIPMPFAENATPGTIEPINATTPAVPQDATWSTGFPQVTMQPLAAGGIPPRGQNFNGVLNALSRHIFHMQGGGQYKWSDDHGPYSIGDVLQSDDGLRSYVSAVDNNTDNFNTNPSAIGTSWLPWGGGAASESVAGLVRFGTSAGTAVQGNVRVNGKALSGTVTITKADVGLGNVTNDTQAKAQTQIIAGTGLEGGGSLAANRTLSVKYGTTAGTAAQGNDSRITGAAQKSANLSDLSSASAARQNLGLGSAATRNVGTGWGNVMQVGAGGWLGAASVNGHILGYPQSQDENISQIYRRDDPDGLVGDYAVSMHMAAGNTWGRLRVSPFGKSAWIQGGSAANGTGWTSQVVLSDTQVITGTGLTGGGNLTTNRTISIANSHIPIGVGQTWQDVSGSRFKNTSYMNTTGRPIYISVAIKDSGGGHAAIRVDGVLVGQEDIASTEISSLGTISAIVPHGSIYIVDIGNDQTINAWAELR